MKLGKRLYSIYKVQVETKLFFRTQNDKSRGKLWV